MNKRVPHAGMVLFPTRPSAMSRNSSLPFLGTEPLGSMMMGSWWPGRMASKAPWKKYAAIFWPSFAFTASNSQLLWLGRYEGVMRQQVRG